LYGIGLIVSVYVSVSHDNPSTRLFWILPIAVFPAFGILLYLMWGLPRRAKRKGGLEYRAHYSAAEALSKFARTEDRQRAERSASFSGNPNVQLISGYLTNQGFPVFANTEMTYFKNGETLFEDCLREIKSARKSIFMAFFILREGELWTRFHEVLARKAAEGIEIRILVDGAGTMFNVSDKMITSLRNEGINIQLFNPTHRYLNNLYLNYRNHQKYVIIDSDIGYTGGINIADEYANFTSPLGYWKDTGIKLVGRGVYGMTVTFICMWDITVKKLSNAYDQYLPSISPQTRGYCHVFYDGPYNNPKNPAEGTIMRMIETARTSLLIATPYLAVSQEFVHTLCRVAKSGVRVALLVPCKLDHWYVFEVTRSFFLPLMEAGVEVYRYSPGMMHAKMIAVDKTHALVGSINLDNRSFFIQYEDGVWVFGNKTVRQVHRDIENAIDRSYRVTVPEIRDAGLLRNSVGYLMRLFSPLM
jgi:cardiolipin synthase